MKNEVTKESPCKDMAMCSKIRSLKVIAPERVLDVERLNLIPLGTDEMFVRIENSNTHYISNYGRCISVTDKVELLDGCIRKKKLHYLVFIWENGERVQKEMPADKLVVDTYYDYAPRRRYIWHMGNDMEDNYYQNLYPLVRKEYLAMEKAVRMGKIDTEELLEEILYNIYHTPTTRGIGYLGSPDADSKHWTYEVWANMMRRCYSEVFQKILPSYIGCSVDEEWYDYSKFKEGQKTITIKLGIVFHN